MEGHQRQAVTRRRVIKNEKLDSVVLSEKTLCPLANGLCEMDRRKILTQRATENTRSNTEENKSNDTQI
jgi:hypothetical protein